MKVKELVKVFAANQKFEIRKTVDAMDCYFEGTLLDYDGEQSDAVVSSLSASESLITLYIE